MFSGIDIKILLKCYNWLKQGKKMHLLMSTLLINIDCFLFFKIHQKKFAILKVWFKFAPAFKEAKIVLSHGVIGNTPVFGTDIQGSSPCGTTKKSSNHLVISVLELFC